MSEVVPDLLIFAKSQSNIKGNGRIQSDSCVQPDGKHHSCNKIVKQLNDTLNDILLNENRKEVLYNILSLLLDERDQQGNK